MAETDMVERVAKACRDAVALDRGRSVPFEEMSYIVARAAIEAMKDLPLDMLGAMHEAMFYDKWDCSQAGDYIFDKPNELSDNRFKELSPCPFCPVPTSTTKPPPSSMSRR